jgi:hypothetical protein
VNDLQQEEMIKAFDDMESAFSAVTEAAELQDISISPYLPEPKSLRDIKNLGKEIQADFITVSRTIWIMTGSK